VLRSSFSPDGRWIVTASWDETARLWEAASGAALRILRGHEGAVSSASFSPDGQGIITASEDQSARLWEAASGNENTSIILDSGVTAASWYDDAVLLGDALGRIHVFDLSPRSREAHDDGR
jgi:WD40 repeat protein